MPDLGKRRDTVCLTVAEWSARKQWPWSRNIWRKKVSSFHKTRWSHQTICARDGRKIKWCYQPPPCSSILWWLLGSWVPGWMFSRVSCVLVFYAMDFSICVQKKIQNNTKLYHFQKCWNPPKITYSKGRHEAFSIHPSIPSSIHGWHHVTRPSIRSIIHPSVPSSIHGWFFPGRNK
jgi:hypothetical protein